MCGQVIHDHHVAGLKSWGELVLHKCAEDIAVRGGVDAHETTPPMEGDGTHHGHRPPCACSHSAGRLLAQRSPAVIGRRAETKPGFIEEDELRRVQKGLLEGEDLTLCFY